MDRRLVIALVGLCAAAVPGALAHGGSTAHQSTAPKSCPGKAPTKDPLLEVVKVDGEPSDDLVPVGTDLDPGTIYTGVVCGTMTRHHPFPEGRTSVVDAFFRVSCTEKDGSACPGGTAPTPSAHLQATVSRDKTLFARLALQWFARGGGTNPEFRKDHSYTLHLDDLGRKILLEHGVCCAGETRTGGFRVEIYGPPPKRYALKFSFSQEGEPLPQIPDHLAGTDTVGGGKVFFSRVPKTGQNASGSPAGIVYHSDNFVFPDLSTKDRQLEVRITSATYVKTKKARVLALRGKVVSESGDAPIHSWDPHGFISIGLVDAYDVETEDDALEVFCAGCSGEDPETATHSYLHGPKGKLVVRISAVREVED